MTTGKNGFGINTQLVHAGERGATPHGKPVTTPSGYDLDHAWPIYSYIIVSVREGQARDLRSWEMESDRSRFNPEEIRT